jgi:hypothetical protein
MATSMKIALALLVLSVCAGCAPDYHDRYGDGYYSGPRRYYAVSERYKPRYYDDDDRRRYDNDRRDRRRYDDDRSDRRLSERYDNRDCYATRDGRVKCYDE